MSSENFESLYIAWLTESNLIFIELEDYILEHVNGKINYGTFLCYASDLTKMIKSNWYDKGDVPLGEIYKNRQSECIDIFYDLAAELSPHRVMSVKAWLDTLHKKIEAKSREFTYDLLTIRGRDLKFDISEDVTAV